MELSKRRVAGKIFALDAPLLIEVGLEKIVDVLIVVTVDRKTQMERCIKRWGLTHIQVEKRIKSLLDQNLGSQPAPTVNASAGEEA